MKNLTSGRHFGMASIVAGVSLLGGLVIQEPPTRETIFALGIGVLLIAVGALLASDRWSVREATAVASAATLGMTGLIVWRFHTFLVGVPTVFVAQAMAVLTLVGVYKIANKDRLLMRAIAALGILVVAWVGIQISYGDVLDIDVYDLHEQAADALVHGKNPYSTGSVAVLESHPFPDRELIEEYTYPPTALVAYAGSSILFGDSRVVGALAIAAAMALALWLIGRSLDTPGRGSHLDAAATALFGANPINYLIVFTGWTEAIALPFLVLAAGLWRKNWVASAIALGIAVSTKQYFLLALPLLAVIPDKLRWKRTAVVVGAAAATFVPFLFWDARGLVDGVVMHHITRAPRLDAATLGGIGINLPSAIAVGGGTAMGLAVVWRSRWPSSFWFGLAAAVGTFTFIAVRGFRNSWWLVIAAVCCAIAFATDGESPLEARDSHRSTDSISDLPAHEDAP
jgi:hypothetical protein